MSADNWAICPKCQKIQDLALEKLARKVSEAYGTVPVEAYLEMRKQLDNPPKMEYTLREDYEVGIKDGDFYISYDAHCKKCNFEYHFQQTDTIRL